MKICFITLGCKLNQAETTEMEEILSKQGHLIVNKTQKPDMVVVRGCAVTQNASQTTREMIRQSKRNGAYVIAGGCLENKEVPEIDYLALTAGDIVRKINQIADKKGLLSSPAEHGREGKTRKFIKIQEGCNFSCTYCVIPKYRGKSKSISANIIVKQINKSVDSGCREVVLTGVNICLYKDNRHNLAGLIKLILQTTDIERIRLGSLDPRLITDDLVRLFKDPRLMPHWHLSLQSGSDSILKKMNRGYTTKKYLSIVSKLKKINPLFSFTTDIIVGFPGESAGDFKQTLNFVKKIGFSKVHVFHYSKRPGTKASSMTNQIQDRIKTLRVKELVGLSEKTNRLFIEKLINKKRLVLFEQKKSGYWIGYSPEYVMVKYKSNSNLKNKIVSLKLTKKMLF